MIVLSVCVSENHRIGSPYRCFALGWEPIQMKGINCDLLSSNYSAFLCFSRLGFQLFFVGHKIAYEAWLTVYLAHKVNK